MINAPCYDVSKKQDCPDRSWCLVNGRSKCSKWVEYERIHKEELDKLHRERQLINIGIEYARERRDKYLKAYSHGKYRLGTR